MYNLIYILTSWWNFYIIKGSFMSVTCILPTVRLICPLQINSMKHLTLQTVLSVYEIWGSQSYLPDDRVSQHKKNYNINNLFSGSLTETYGDSVS